VQSLAQIVLHENKIGSQVSKQASLMNTHFLLRAIGLVCALSFASAEEAGLHYKFKTGETNAYRVTFESKSENNAQRFEGVIAVSVLNAEGPQATLSFGGTLQPGQGPRRMPFGPRGPFGHLGGFPPGMAGGPQGPLWTMFLPPPVLGQNESVVDVDGNVLRYPVALGLPKPLENYAALFLGRLPSSTNFPPVILQVDDELFGNRPYSPRFGPSPGPQGPARLLGERRESVRVVERQGAEIHLERTVEFRTALKTGDDPRVSYSTKAQIVFSADDGWPKSGRIEGTAILSTLDFTMKSPILLTFEKLEGDALAQALLKGGFIRPEAPTEADIRKLVEQLKSDDIITKNEAATQLSALNIEKEAASLLPALRPFIGSTNPLLRNLAARAFAAAATADDVPLLLKLLATEDLGDQHSYIQALRRLKDARAVEPLAEIIAHGYGSSYSAAEALGEFGKAAEDAALELLKEKHIETKRAACRILQQAGTPKSAEALEDVIKEGDSNLIPTAAEALRAIRRRGEEAENLLL
jgi:HEAT repeat protein